MSRPTMTQPVASRPHRTPIDWIAGVLLVVGGLNWGLVGLVNLDLVAAIFGAGSIAARIVYVLVGLSAVYCLIRAFITSSR